MTKPSFFEGRPFVRASGVTSLHEITASRESKALNWGTEYHNSACNIPDTT
jgi:hypothetical protein